MRRFMLFITTREDKIDIIKFSEEQHILLKKYDCIGVLDEAMNPFILDEKDDSQGYQ